MKTVTEEFSEQAALDEINKHLVELGRRTLSMSTFSSHTTRIPVISNTGRFYELNPWAGSHNIRVRSPGVVVFRTFRRMHEGLYHPADACTCGRYEMVQQVVWCRNAKGRYCKPEDCVIPTVPNRPDAFARKARTQHAHWDDWYERSTLAVEQSICSFPSDWASRTHMILQQINTLKADENMILSVANE